MIKLKINNLMFFWFKISYIKIENGIIFKVCIELNPLNLNCNNDKN